MPSRPDIVRYLLTALFIAGFLTMAVGIAVRHHHVEGVAG